MAPGADTTFAKGDRVDRFEIHELIAEGGMGAVYRAIDTRLQRTVALKVVRADRLDSSAGDEARERFLREALAVSKVDHRNVVRLFDFGFSGETPYLAMEYLRGRDLGALIKATVGPLAITEVVEVMLGVCAAIRACHDAGIIHRDLKPSNVFLCDADSQRHVKILDFGVSKPPMASDLTREGQIVGTPQYLAPEQVDGKAVPETDQYAIGVMLYRCLTKALPYQNHASLGLLRAILVGKFPPPRELRPDIPEALEAIILRAMRVPPEERFESVFALGRELWQFASADGQQQWRSYYLDNALRAPPKASAHAMPLIEAMARGLPAPEGPAERPPPEAESPDSVAFASTAFAGTPVAAKPESAEVPPVALSSASPAAPPTARATRMKPALIAALIAGGALALGVGWATLGPPSDRKAPSATVPIEPAPPAASAPPDPIQRPAPKLPAAAAPVSATQLETSAPPPLSAPHVEKHHRRNTHRHPSEHAADGVPIMP